MQNELRAYSSMLVVSNFSEFYSNDNSHALI